MQTQIPAPLDEESIMLLCELGFERDKCENALRLNHGNTDIAASYLLAGGDTQSAGSDDAVPPLLNDIDDADWSENTNPLRLDANTLAHHDAQTRTDGETVSGYWGAMSVGFRPVD